MWCKSGAWKKESSMDALKCWNFERVLDAYLHRKPTPLALTLEKFLKKGEGSDGSAIVKFSSGLKVGSEGCCMSYDAFNFLYECFGGAIFFVSSFISLCYDLNLKMMFLSHLFRSN